MPILTPSDLQSFMQAHAIAGEIIWPGVPTPSVDLAAQALGVRPEQVLKSILFFAGRQPVLAIAGGRQPIEKRAIAAECGCSRKQVRLASAEELIAIGGYRAGGMPPFGHLQALPTLLDAQAFLLESAYAGGGAENAMLHFNPTDILGVSPTRVIALTTTSEA